jgi:deoxyadenosine/deoxycytidine kinase
MLSAIQKIIDNNLRYNIAIAGPMASGKTTLCDYIWNELGKLNIQLKDDQERDSFIHYYKEWIDHSDLCKEMLVNRTKGLISRFTLQSFILDEWMNILTKEPLKNFNLFERSISECSMCFCGDLTFKEYDVLHSREYDIAKSFGIPCVDSEFSFCVSTKESTEDIYNELVKQISADVDFMISSKLESFNRIFGLKMLDAETHLSRIGKRARPGEEDIEIRKMNAQLDIFKRAYNKFEYRSKWLINPEEPMDETLINGC